MEPTTSPRPASHEPAVPVRIKLAALWASVMFLYIYADYFGLYVPGKVQHILEGRMGPLGAVSQGVLLGASMVMVIPSLMIFLSVALPAGINRALNIVFGIFYTLIILVTMWQWWFYVLYGVLEIALTGLVVAYAWRWRTRGA